MSVRILVGDVRTRLNDLPDQSVQMCVTSPPYFGLRDYGNDGQIGLESTPDAFVAELVGVFREVKRVLRDDGTLWLNLGDSYCGSGGAGNQFKPGGIAAQGVQAPSTWKEFNAKVVTQRIDGLKSKDLIGIPWRVAFALQADGWYLRSDIIWHKPNPMPESVTDRPTKSHEYLFLLTKSERYYYDADAIREPHSEVSIERVKRPFHLSEHVEGRAVNTSEDGDMSRFLHPNGRNRRSVWTVPTSPFKGAHFATFPPALIKPCILAGCPEGGTVLDTFGGAGTTGLVADRLGRNAILCELNPAYAQMASERIAQDNPIFTQVNIE